MRHPFSFLGAKRTRGIPGFEALRSMFSKFRRIQQLNARALGKMAEMERALGGEYIFDRAFIESSVRDLGSIVHQVVYSLNALSRNRHVDLLDRFESVKGILMDILGGGLGPFADHPTLPLSALGWGMEPLAGETAVSLAEINHHLDVPVPDGFVVTATGCRLLAETGARDGTPPDMDESPRSPSWPPVEEAIARELRAIETRNGKPTLFSVRLRTAAAAQELPESPDLPEAENADPPDVLPACRSLLTRYFRENPGEGTPAPVLLVLETTGQPVSGTIGTRSSPRFPAGLFRIVAVSGEEPGRSAQALLRKTHPFDPVLSEISPHAREEPARFGSGDLALTSGGLLRGSALLEPGTRRRLAAVATAVERLLGHNAELAWAIRGDGRIIVLDVPPTGGGETMDPSVCAMDGVIENHEVLLRGGEAAQTGVSAGPCVHVREPFDAARFPRNAVAVAPFASPGLCPVLRRASAVVTEVGTAVGHLATIARELRVPALFGVPGAMARLPEGAEVTVDAGAGLVYAGIVEELVAGRGCGAELFPTDPEYVLMKRLLHWIQPLGLTDPEAADFNAAGCRTFHDILHYAHERSIEELLDVGIWGGELNGPHARRLDVGTPLDLFVVDVGGGLSPGAGTPVTPEDVLSEPFRAFLEGLAGNAAWGGEPAPLRLRDVFSGLDRTLSAVTASTAGHFGRNHAIIASNTMNVGLRLGYHYSIVDSTCGANMNQNHVYFRFAGGFADETRRRRRAALIRALLEELRFKVSVDGDLVVARLRAADRAETASALARLGELTGFTRQLDLSLTSEEMADRFAERFRNRSRSSGDPAPDGEEGETG